MPIEVPVSVVYKAIILLFVIASYFWGVGLPNAQAFSRSKSIERPCPQIRLINSEKLNFTDAEIRLLCGDPDPQRVGRAWKSIPLSQAQTNYRNFLQDRGYFSPEFTESEPGIVQFNPGVQSRVRKWVSLHLPPDIQLQDNRNVIGEVLTPKLVESAGAWVRRRMQEEGYPCPQINARANPETGEMSIEWLNPGPKAQISGLQEDPQSEVIPHLLRRFDAFSIGDSYSLVQTEITRRRSDDIKLTVLNGLHPLCLNEGTKASPSEIQLGEKSEFGLPRIIYLSLGMNSEVGPAAQGSWSHTRLGSLGSTVEVKANASLLDRSLLATSEWYFLGPPSRQRFSPRIQFSNISEPRYVVLALRTHFLWKIGGDFSDSSWSFSVGPNWQNIQQVKGIGPLNSQYYSLQSEVSWTSHRFEYYLHDPREGFTFSFGVNAVPQSILRVGSPVSLRWGGQWLTYPGSADPPWAIFGVRFRGFANLVSSGTRFEDLPIDFRSWVGGGRDVRGFGRQELPGNDFGARMGFTLGTEIRVPKILPLGIEPLVLLDGALVRGGPVTTTEEDNQMFFSPGIGFRVSTPFGVVRSTLAHGYAVNSPDSILSHWQFFFSLGEEF